MFFVIEVDNDGFKVYDSAGNVIDPAKDLSVVALGTILTAIKNTDGIKKIVDALPAGTNNIGDVDIVSSVLPTGASTEATLLLIKTKTDNIPSDPARESGKLTSLETLITAIRDTAGIKKITDPLQMEGRGPVSSAPVGNPVYVAGRDGTTLRALLTDSAGRMIIANPGASAVSRGFKFGAVPTSGSAIVRVEATTYTEQTSGAQRSIVCVNANDTALGTGARKVRITYLKADYTGPFTEDVVTAGTTPVDTVATDLCFIEKMDVIEVGSNGTNVGVISIKTTTGGGGSTFGSIAVGTVRGDTATGGDGKTLWAHHYVPTGKTMHITGIMGGNAANTSIGCGGTFWLRSLPLGVTNAMEQQISDFVHQFGQDSSVLRLYGTPIDVVGPSRVTAFVLPDASLTVVYTVSWDFYED